MKISRNWLQKYFNDPLPNVEDLEDAFTFHSFEIEERFNVPGDAVLDVKVLPNRAGDCLSHRGIAKELSAILKLPLTEDPFRESAPSFPTTPLLSVSIADSALCTRYMGGLIRGVTVGPSPLWLREALEAVGQRSINNVVDATNYVMLDIGQPLHAFDAGKLSATDSGHYSLWVQNAKDGESFTTLSGDTYVLSKETLLITDGNSEEALGIAGVKGGRAAAIDESTVDIIIESAHFNYASIRKTAQRLKLFTDASTRFQNNPSPELASYGMYAVISLIQKIAGGELVGVTDVYPNPTSVSPVTFPLRAVNERLGTNIEMDEALAILERLGITTTSDGEMITSTPPFERRDIAIPEDLIEEVGRLHGYRTLEAIPLPEVSHPPEINKRFFYAEKVREALIPLGFSEVLTYSFQSQGEVEIANPLASDKAFLRSELDVGISAALTDNARYADLLGIPLVRIFEIGRVFEKEGEYTALALGVRDPKGKAKNELTAVMDALEALRTIFPNISGTPENGVIEWNFDALIAELPDPIAYAPVTTSLGVPYRPISQYPFILRDISVWVPEGIEKESVVTIIETIAGPLLVRTTLFDTFAKDGKVSYAFRLVFQSYEKTLSDEEITAVMSNITDVLNATPLWQVR